MRIVGITAVFEDGTVPTDGSAPLRVQAIDLAWVQWTDGRVAITAVGANGSPYNLSGGAFIFTARTRNQAAAPTISHEGVIDDASAGLAHIDIGSVDVGLICQTLAWNLTFIDSGGKIWATTAQGFFSIGPGEYVPGQDVTVPESQQPLAQGPNFGNSDTFADFPAASSKAWLAWVADDTNLAYYSDGTTWRPLAPGGGALSPTVLGTLKNTAEVGDTITVRGTGLSAVKQVLFGGVSATFTVVNSTTVTATVPVGAVSGPLQLLMDGGLLDVGEFTVINTSSAMTIDFRAPALDPRILVAPADGQFQLLPTATGPTTPLGRMIVTSGRFPPYQSLDYTVRFPWSNTKPMASFYITSAASTDGAHALYVDSSGRLTAEILGSTANCAPNAMPYISEGSEIEVRYYYDGIASGDQAVHLRVNGCYMSSSAQWVTCNPSTGPTNLAVPTAFYLGSNLGATPTPDGFSYLLSEGQAHTGVAPVEIVLLGDSLTAAVTDRKGVGTAIYYPSERWTRGGIMAVAQGGDTIANQQALWAENQYLGATTVKAICILLGINDISGGASASTVLASLNTLTAYVKANNSGAKVLLSTLLPAKNALTGPQFTVWQAVNASIVGGSVTNVDLVITAASTELDDGTGAMKWWYDYGDGLHENDKARDVIAQAYRDGLVSLGVLP